MLVAGGLLAEKKQFIDFRWVMLSVMNQDYFLGVFV